MSSADFDAFERTPLHGLQASDWDAYYERASAWLTHPSRDVRARAVNRACAAVLWAEPQSLYAHHRQHHPAGSRCSIGTARLQWLLDQCLAAAAVHHDVWEWLLSELRFRPSEDAFVAYLLMWLHRHRDHQDRRLAAMIEGSIVIMNSCDEDDAADVARVVALLDHADDYVRACAARVLSGLDGSAVHPPTMFALVKSKELMRPGIAGPYWSEWSLFAEHAPVDAAEWMMEILEKRIAPEPPLPFSGVDFYLHEVCATSPALVERMMRGGHHALALETATEMDEPVEGMEPLLQKLAAHHNEHISNRAKRQLAKYIRGR
jgi:hypothetical protein